MYSAEGLYARHALRRTLTRVAPFVAASIALHALTLAAYVPSGVPGAIDSGPVRALNATLSRAQTIANKPQDRDADTVTGASAHGAAAAAETPPERHGTPGGVDVPLPDRWFTAQELDVRAEPLRYVSIEYPEALAGTGMAGRVQLALFIDESGRLQRLKVLRAVPEGVFDQAAIDAWRGVTFSPAMKGGVAVKSEKILELVYSPI